MLHLNIAFSLEYKIEKDNNSLKWFMGSDFVVITVLLTIIALKH
ncbi:MAG: hypothetical protein QM528_03415 [Phycisphaerales bacterium]|nr:hypothetical protein [Phycisphaerales bacterium]